MSASSTIALAEDLRPSTQDFNVLISGLNEKYESALCQIQLLTDMLQARKIRLKRANLQRHRPACYSQELQLRILRATRDMFRKYAVQVADKVARLKLQAAQCDQDDDVNTEDEVSDLEFDP